MLAALGCFLAGRQSVPLMNRLVSLTGVVVFALCLWLNFSGSLSFTLEGFCGLGLHLRADGFRAIYAGIAAFMWMMTGLFAPEYFAHYHNRARYSFFNLMTLGATLGVFLSDDLYSTFIFFEVMSFTSYTWVAHEETPGAMKAAGTYLAVAVIGGLTTLMGLFLVWFRLGTLSFDGIRAAMSGTDAASLALPAWLVVVGFGAKAGLYPLHIWLPKAHPVAPAPASALLSGILTKSGVFGLIVVCSRLMPGNAAFGNALLVLAVITMFLGALLALLSVDLKRTLACSSMSQIGFITVGLSIMVLLGEDGSLAAYGAVMHMMNHSLIKLVLFMAAGVVYMNLHQLNLNDIRGFGRKKPLLHIAFLLGALSIGGVPPIGSGYNSKSLLHEAILEYIAHLQAHGGAWAPYKAVEILFLVSGGLTVAYMTKLYLCIFWEKHPTRQAEFDAKKDYMNAQSAFALLGSAVVLPLLGTLPGVILSPVGARSAAFFGQEASHHAIAYFSGENLLGAAESIAIGAAVYLLIVRRFLSRREADGSRVYLSLWPAWLDLEELIYRPLVMELLPNVTGAITGFIAAIPDGRLVRIVIPQGVTAIVRFFSELPENITVLLRHSVFRMRRTTKLIPVGNRITWSTGRFINACARLLNKTVLRRRPLRTDFEYVFAASWREFKDSVSSLTISVSFGLLLLCIGLYVTCVYLLW
ncbi:MAG: NADH dehydrogenase [Christensenellaceae bacterium]|nr:NADH dehydrogenase [Christensenellaceae bacterium]